LQCCLSAEFEAQRCALAIDPDGDEQRQADPRWPRCSNETWANRHVRKYKLFDASNAVISRLFHRMQGHVAC
jgi:hypothetical protein